MAKMEDKEKKEWLNSFAEGNRLQMINPNLNNTMKIIKQAWSL